MLLSFTAAAGHAFTEDGAARSAVAGIERRAESTCQVTSQHNTELCMSTGMLSPTFVHIDVQNKTTFCRSVLVISCASVVIVMSYLIRN